MTARSYSVFLESVREKCPLVHHITNYVTVNDCANITMCAGAAPVMAHALEEVEEMVSYAGALVLNIGTLDPAQITSMLKAGHAAESHNIPIILDPVGAGATELRTSTARMLMNELSISVLKGNAGEIGVLAGADAEVRGVDSAGLSGDAVSITKSFAERTGITVVMSGKTDIISDGKKTLLVDNGDPMMGAISGTGCMAASLIGAYAAVSSDYVDSSAVALAVFGLAGEWASKRSSGPGSFKMALFDDLSRIRSDDIDTGGKIRSV